MAERLQDLLGLQEGTVAAIGSGGKTSLLRALAEGTDGRCLLATTTRFLPFDGVPTLLDPTVSETRAAFERDRVVCVGSAAERGKLAEPTAGLEAFAPLASWLLVEADGSKRLPLKAHASWEPVVPSGAQVVLVVGATGLGGSVEQMVHRPELFCERVGCTAQDIATPELVAQALLVEIDAGAIPSPQALLVNQVDALEAATGAQRLAKALRAGGFSGRVVGASLAHGRWESL